MEYIDNISDILFACLAEANLYYGLFNKLIKEFFFFLSSDKPKDYTINIYYRWYSKLVAGIFAISNNTIYENNTSVDNKYNKGAKNNNCRKKKDDN